MARKIKWTEAAWSDLEDVSYFIQKDSSFYAAAFVREVRDASRSLSFLAERGRIVPEFGEPSVREIFVRRYRLIYNITNQTVFIIGFIHGARDLGELWKREERLTF